eukprot:g29026.t1
MVPQCKSAASPPGSAAVPVQRFRSFGRLSTSTSPRDLHVHRTYSSPRSQTYTSRLVPLTSASPRTSDVEVRTITGVSAATRSQRWQDCNDPN